MTLEGQPPPEDKSPSREVGTSGPGIDDRPPGAQPLLRDDPKFLGSYELHWRLGVGTSGVTYLAESNVGDVVVVKLLWPHIAQDSSRRAQIFRDIESLGAVSNERFVRLLEADPAAQPPWFAMEYVPGPTLKDFVAKHGPLRDAALQDFADDLAAAVQDVHRVGIILRNLTPDDIVMANPGPRIIDFGAARLFDVTQLTNSGSAKGIPGWMAPEQLTLDPVTRAVDVHAWALCVLFAATGLAPYQGETAEEAMTRVVWNEPEIPATVPDRLRKALRLALAKRASSRPSLAQLRAGQLPEAITDPETTPSRGHRRKWALTLGAIVVVTAILAALITAVGSMPPSGSAPVAGPSATASETTARVATPAVPPQVEELTLSADSQIVEVGQGFMLRVQTMPLVAGASLVIEESSSRSGGAGGWHPIASLRSDQGGQAEWFQAGVSRSGIVEFRVSHPTGQGSQILSGPIAVTIQKRVTASVVAKWPSGPAEYCGEQEIPVRLVPPEPGRLVELQYSSNGQLWQKADDAPANQGGKARLRVPDCSTRAGVEREVLTWRVLAPESEAFTERASDFGRLTMCPGPMAVQVSTVEVYRARYEFAVTNSSEQCTATVRITAGVICEVSPSLSVNSRIGSEYVGQETSAAFEIGAGETTVVADRTIGSNGQVNGGLFTFQACAEYPYNGMGALTEVSAFAELFSPAT